MNRKRGSFQTLKGPRNTGKLIVGLLLCCAALLPALCSGATYQVKQDGTGDFTTIQAAIDASVGGDVIVVHPGTYCENIHFDGKNITLRSLDPEDEQIVASTVIDGAQNGSVVMFRGTEDQTCLLSGFTITNGRAHEGGGIWGGAYPGPGTRARVSNCTISGNAANGYGGALYCCNGTISNCTISENLADYGSGGGLACCDGPVSNCTISDNSADTAGGLYECYGTISNCAIISNHAHARGGLYLCYGRISNCTISGNTAINGGGLSDCNGAISNCTISGNSALYEGGGLSNCDGAISNCIIWGNQGERGGNQLYHCESAVITYCCIQGWTGGGEGNISHDPLFLMGPLGDYYLSCAAAGQPADSPCIDASTGTAESLGLDKFTTRTDGVLDAGPVDMGYHYPLTKRQSSFIECMLNYPGVFAPGDPLVGFIEAQNRGPDVAVDAYVAFVLSNGEMISLTASGLSMGTYPWVSNVVLPSGFHFGPRKVLRATVPDWPGSYLFAAALTNPGQFECIGEPSLFPFTISE